MKDADSCEKPWGGANDRRSTDLRMGWGHGGRRREVNHLSTCRKGNQDETPLVAASERGTAQTARSDPRGVVGRRRGDRQRSPDERNGLGRPAGQGESPVRGGR